MINKKLTIFEFTIISFFVAVILSIVIVFVTNQEGYSALSFPLNYITLSIFVSKFNFSESYELVFNFLYYTIVFTIYGFILGVINKYSNWIKYFSILFITTIVFLVFQENSIIKTTSVVLNNQYVNSASVIKSVPDKNKKYFGLEAYGDLNLDGNEDVAFIIKRKDEIRGDLYYISASLKVDDGYEGLNLLFLGDKEIPGQIIIEDGIIGVELNKTIFYAQIIDNEIKELVY